MTRDEIKMECLRTQAIAREDYGYHLFLQRWWTRDGYGYAPKPVVYWEQNMGWGSALEEHRKEREREDALSALFEAAEETIMLLSMKEDDHVALKTARELQEAMMLLRANLPGQDADQQEAPHEGGRGCDRED